MFDIQKEKGMLGFKIMMEYYKIDAESMKISFDEIKELIQTYYDILTMVWEICFLSHKKYTLVNHRNEEISDPNETRNTQTEAFVLYLMKLYLRNKGKPFHHQFFKLYMLNEFQGTAKSKYNLTDDQFLEIKNLQNQCTVTLNKAILKDRK